jgi:hypothetical protein
VNASFANATYLVNVMEAFASKYGVGIGMTTPAFRIVSAKKYYSGNRYPMLNSIKDAVHTLLAKPKQLRIRRTLRLGTKAAAQIATNAIKLANVG